MSIPFGEWMMEVVQHGIYKNDNGKPYIGVTFRHETGEECQTQVYITEKAVGMAKKALKKMGFDISDMSKVKVLNENHSFLSGNKCLVNVWEDDYGGRLRTKYDIVLRDDPVEGEELDVLGAILAEKPVEKKAKPAARAPRRTEPTKIEKEVAEHRADVEKARESFSPAIDEMSEPPF